MKCNITYIIEEVIKSSGTDDVIQHGNSMFVRAVNSRLSNLFFYLFISFLFFFFLFSLLDLNNKWDVISYMTVTYVTKHE